MENFGEDYIFVNPNLEKSNSHPAKICLVNGENYTVKMNISGITDTSRISLVPGRKVQVDANYCIHSIRADVPIDVQILTSFAASDTLQIGLVPNHQFANAACFSTASKYMNHILVALTDDVKNPNSSLVLNDKLFDFGLFRRRRMHHTLSRLLVVLMINRHLFIQALTLPAISLPMMIVH